MRLDAIRREPFRLLFPLGIALAWAGVFHWLLLGLGVIDSYHSIFHSMAQVQGFLTCFVTGFLFTMIPRRTGTAPAARWELALAVVAPIATTLAAWEEHWALAQFCWLALVAAIVSFALRRFRAAARAPIPNSFVWIPGSLLLGVLGSVLAAVGAARGPGSMWIHDLGRAIVLQGMLAGMILGVGGMLFPMLTRGVPAVVVPSVRAKLGHLFALTLFCASFWLEVAVDLRAGLILRAAVIASVLVVSGGVLHPPTRPEIHRRLVWIAAWALVLGPALQAAFPGYRRAAMHVTFIGGFALMALAVSIHVFLEHGARARVAPRRALLAFAVMLGTALTCRGLMDVDPAHFRVWTTGASASFLAAALVWAAIVTPSMYVAKASPVTA